MIPKKRSQYLIVVFVLLISGCGRAHREVALTKDNSQLKITFLTREGCPNTPKMRSNLDAALSQLGISHGYPTADLGALPNDDPRTAYGTPTVLVNGRDLFGKPVSTEPSEPT